jgi:hypothetical protein
MSNVERLAETVETGSMEALVSGGYSERTYNAHLWKCSGCGLCWSRRRQAEDCEHRGHVARYEDGPYGVRFILNGVPQGDIHYYTRQAVRRDPVPSGTP